MNELGDTAAAIPDLQSEPLFAFGPFKLLPFQKLLLKSNSPHIIGNRALELLTLLADRAGSLVSKEDLFAHAWPNLHVEEINLRVHIAALRKVLGCGHNGLRYIKTLPGRGYCFTAPVMRMNWTGVQHAIGSPPIQLFPKLPMRLTSMIGRTEIVETLSRQLDRRRFVTIVGPGGIGKTTVALTIARGSLDRYKDGVYFVDIAPLAEEALVPTALASALGLSIASGDALPHLLAYLHDKSMLLLLDNCEHVLAAIADLAEGVLRSSRNIHILSTSREPLHAEGEWIHRLKAMTFPDDCTGLTAADAIKFPAIQLFVERAAAVNSSFWLQDANAPDIATLCRRLDGLPLAIELAAARIKLFDVKHLAAELDDRLLLFSEGRRRPLPRHQTLHATLEWSYGLLASPERAILRSVSIYKASFSIECAVSVSTAPGLAERAILQGIENLADKSLLQIDTLGPYTRCRLLDSTRAFAYGKLRELGEVPRLRKLHAHRLVQILTKAEADWDELNASDWIALYGHLMDDIRAALNWSLSSEGDDEIAVTLTSAAVPLWMHLSLTNECSESVARVIARTGQFANGSSDDRYRRMKLLNALGLSLLYTKGPSPQIESALDEARELAEGLRDVDYQLRSLWGSFVSAFNEGNYAKALVRAELFRSVATTSRNPYDLKAGDRLLGFALHLLGNQTEARRYIEGMLDSYVVPTRRSDFIRFQYDQRVAARVPLSTILWLQGYPDKAMDNATRAVEEAQSINHAVSLGYALSTSACCIAFFFGDLVAAARFVAMLVDHSAAYGLGPWSAWGRYFKSVLAARTGYLEEGLQGIGAALAELRSTGFVLRYTSYLAEYAELLGKANRLDAALTLIDEALLRCERDQEGWCLAELLRVKGDLLLREGLAGSVTAATELFDASLDHARKTGTPAWELRTAISIATLRARQGHLEEGQQLLSPIFAKFTEGYASQDLIAARNILQESFTEKEHGNA